MIVLGYIGIHPKGCIRKVIVKRLRVLLISHFQIQKHISGDSPHVWSVKSKKFHQSYVVMMHLNNKIVGSAYLCWFAHKEPYVPYKTMLENIVGSASSYRW
jgi:hypothetical protein